jgi:large subunit ribosomal protein L6
MSRIGKKPITVPSGVEIKIEGDVVKVKGPKGNLEQRIHSTMMVTAEKGVITVSPKANDKNASQFQGLTRTLINNMVVGVTTGYKKTLQLVGVGYRAAKSGQGLDLSLGFSHPVKFDPPKGVQLEVDKQTVITVAGASKEDVGETAAKIRAIRPPEPYHGKGVRYIEEKIITKVGKAAGKK